MVVVAHSSRWHFAAVSGISAFLLLLASTSPGGLLAQPLNYQSSGGEPAFPSFSSSQLQGSSMRCAAGWDMEGDRCVNYEYVDPVVRCPPGFRAFNQRCFAFAAAREVCPSGFEIVDGRCVALRSVAPRPTCRSAEFVLEGDDSCVMEVPRKSKCPPGFPLPFVQLPQQGSSGPNSFVVEDARLISEAEVALLSDDSSLCGVEVPSLRKCPRSFAPSGRHCIRPYPAIPVCPLNSTLVTPEARCKEQRWTQPSCPPEFSPFDDTKPRDLLSEDITAPCFRLSASTLGPCPTGFHILDEAEISPEIQTAVSDQVNVSSVPAERLCLQVLESAADAHCQEREMLENPEQPTCRLSIPRPTMCPSGFHKNEYGRCERHGVLTISCPTGFFKSVSHDASGRNRTVCQKISYKAKIRTCPHGFAVAGAGDRCRAVDIIPASTRCPSGTQGTADGKKCVKSATIEPHYHCREGYRLTVQRYYGAASTKCVRTINEECPVKETKEECELSDGTSAAEKRREEANRMNSGEGLGGGGSGAAPRRRLPPLSYNGGPMGTPLAVSNPRSGQPYSSSSSDVLNPFSQTPASAVSSANPNFGFRASDVRCRSVEVVINRRCSRLDTIEPEMECPNNGSLVESGGMYKCSGEEVLQREKYCRRYEGEFMDHEGRCFKMRYAPFSYQCPNGTLTAGTFCHEVTEISPQFGCQGGFELVRSGHHSTGTLPVNETLESTVESNQQSEEDFLCQHTTEPVKQPPEIYQRPANLTCPKSDMLLRGQTCFEVNLYTRKSVCPATEKMKLIDDESQCLETAEIVPPSEYSVFHAPSLLCRDNSPAHSRTCFEETPDRDYFCPRGTIMRERELYPVGIQPSTNRPKGDAEEENPIFCFATAARVPVPPEVLREVPSLSCPKGFILSDDGDKFAGDGGESSGRGRSSGPASEPLPPKQRAVRNPRCVALSEAPLRNQCPPDFEGPLMDVQRDRSCFREAVPNYSCPGDFRMSREGCVFRHERLAPYSSRVRAQYY